MIDYLLIKQLYNVDALVGCSEEEIEQLKQIYGSLPRVFEDFLRTLGNTEKLQHGQDTWLFPAYYQRYTWMRSKEYADYLILMNENQGVYQLVLKREDLHKENPSVYVLDGAEILGICTDTLSEFLMGMLLYQAIFVMEYNPEDFFWYSDEDVECIRVSMQKLPYEIRNWYSDTIEFYTNAEGNLLYLMCEEYQSTYGATTEEAYKKLLMVVGDFGEEV